MKIWVVKHNSYGEMVRAFTSYEKAKEFKKEICNKYIAYDTWTPQEILQFLDDVENDNEDLVSIHSVELEQS